MTPHERLGQLVDQRLLAAGLTVTDVGRTSGVDVQTWRAVIRGIERKYMRGTKIGITKALQWSPDSIDRILAGGEPVPQAIVRSAMTAEEAAQPGAVERNQIEIRQAIRKAGGAIRAPNDIPMAASRDRTVPVDRDELRRMRAVIDRLLDEGDE